MNKQITDRSNWPYESFLELPKFVIWFIWMVSHLCAV